MRNEYDVADEFMKNLFENTSWKKFGIEVTKKAPTLSESVETEEEYEDDEVNEEVESEFACPLCESELEGPLSEERISEHIDTVLTLVSESLNESEELEEEELEEAEA